MFMNRKMRMTTLWVLSEGPDRLPNPQNPRPEQGLRGSI